MARDRFDYGDVVGESWKSQMLLNLVKIRYGDSPVFLDVGSIVAGYSFQRSISASASGNGVSAGFPAGTAFGTAGVGASGSFNDSPTITYSPLQGVKFARSLMTPIPTTALMNVIQTGFPVDQVLRLAAQSVNGLDNRRSLDLGVQPANPEFYALLRELRRIQNSGDIGMRMDNSGGEVVLQMVLRPKSAAAVENARLNVTKFLGLNPAAREFSVVYGAVQRTNTEIAILEPVHLSSAFGSVVEHCGARERRGEAPGNAHARRRFEPGRNHSAANPDYRDRGPSQRRFRGHSLSRSLVFGFRCGHVFQAHVLIHPVPFHLCRDRFHQGQRAGPDHPHDTMKPLAKQQTYRMPSNCGWSAAVSKTSRSTPYYSTVFSSHSRAAAGPPDTAALRKSILKTRLNP